jgi:heptosyltransferase-2
MPTRFPVKPAEPTAILVRMPNWLGDLVMATGFLDALLARFPAARVDVIVPRRFETLPLPRRGELLLLDRAAWSSGAFGRSLRGRGYSHLFVLPPSFSAAWMAFCARVPARIGYRGNFRSWLLRPALAYRAPPRSVHLLQEYLDLLAPWQVLSARQFPPRLAVNPEWVAEHLPPAAASPARRVVFAPGAEYGPARQWPAEHYRALAQALARAGWTCTVIGLLKHRPLGDEILAGVAGGLNLCGETLTQMVAVLARAALVVSNDSGVMHVAAALGRPQIALLGSTQPLWTGPLNPAARVLTRQEPCSPCYARECRFGHTRCLVELRPRQVAAEALEVLGNAPRN